MLTLSSISTHPLLPPPSHLTSGLAEEGLYRKPGVLSKANKLLRDAIERGKVDQLDISDKYEWDTRTLASALKRYFSKQLGEPLLTFRHHQEFIDAASKYIN